MSEQYDSQALRILHETAASNDVEPESGKRAGGLRLEGKGFENIIFSHWGPNPNKQPAKRSPFADDAAAHRAELAAKLPGERLVIPAGTVRHRTWDTDFLFRTGSAFAHMTGLGRDLEAGAVLVIDPTVEANGTIGHHATIYLEPTIDRTNPRFFSDSKHGEFWIGPRPLPEDFHIMTGLDIRDMTEFADALRYGAGPDSIRIRVLRGYDPVVDATVDHVREENGLGDADANRGADAVLEERSDECRIIKTPREVAEIVKAVEATKRGFERVADILPIARKVKRGERLLEATFTHSCRYEGNGISFGTNAASGPRATILDYHANDHALKDGELFLLDAGIELDSLYAADITRTFPINGTFTEPQREIYQAVLDASNAAIDAANKPGAVYHDMLDAALASVACSLYRLGILPVSVEEALRPDGHQHYRWLYHGTGHHMGIDVHDAYRSRNEYYPDAPLKPGMVFTLEPGLYFDAADELVPERYRGIGVRIEDDLMVDETGTTRLISDFARTPDEVEAFLRTHGPEQYLDSFIEHEAACANSD
ncbi:Xaa-Pro aminopeptidase [Bifidobacterium hapali]|uniref:Xaa-Pro aminopeptidase n=1 Tax=Bifidobacterium hapali TaxID=1630172 RepID=A0A261FUG4_9BIFI|nr:aminopeptidase P family protein [Bifidobacterium hapali]OZG62585.1 Xaa-Pro aminopeptidase [Bifidobacterium hapali]